MTTTAASQAEMTVEELAARVGAIPLWRIRTDPPPGQAGETLDGGTVLPGFSVPVAELFAAKELGDELR